MPTRNDRIRALAAARGRVAALLTVAMIAIYFGFIALIAFANSVCHLAPRTSQSWTLATLWTLP